MKTLKASNYKSLKQNVVVKNKIDTVNGSMMNNVLTDSLLLGTNNIAQTVSDLSTVSYTDRNKQQGTRIDAIHKSHALAVSIVGVSMKTYTTHFSLETPVAGRVFADVSLSGKTYKLPRGQMKFDDAQNNVVNEMTMQNFIVNNSARISEDWSNDSAYVDYTKKRVNMFAWVKRALTVSWTTKYIGPTDPEYARNIIGTDEILTNWSGPKNWGMLNDPNCELDASSTGRGFNNRPSTWYSDGQAIVSPCQYQNPYQSGRNYNGVWSNQPEFLRLDSGLLSNYDYDRQNGHTYSNMPETVVAQSVAFNERYNEFEIQVKQTDALGYEFDVTVTVPVKYVYGAASRNCRQDFFLVLKEWEDVDSLAFVDFVENIEVKLYGQVLDEETNEFSKQLDANNNLIDSKGSYLFRIANNELITSRNVATGTFTGKVAWTSVMNENYVVSGENCTYDADNLYTITVTKPLSDYDEPTRNYILKMIDADMYIIETVNGPWDPKVQFNYMFCFGDIYSKNISIENDNIVITVTGLAGSSIQLGQMFTIRLKTYVEVSDVTSDNSWMQFVAKSLISNFSKGRLVINCEVDSSFIMDTKVKINDWYKFADINGNYIMRKGKITYFELKSIKKLYNNEKYTYSLTLIETDFGETSAFDSRLIFFTEYNGLNTYVNLDEPKYIVAAPKRIETVIYEIAADQIDTINFTGWQSSHTLTLQINSIHEPASAEILNITKIISIGKLKCAGNYDDYAYVEFEEAYWDTNSHVVFIPFTPKSNFDPEKIQINLVSINIKYSIDVSDYKPNDFMYELAEAYKGQINVVGKAIANRNLGDMDPGFSFIEGYNELTDAIVILLKIPVYDNDINLSLPHYTITDLYAQENYGVKANPARSYAGYYVRDDVTEYASILNGFGTNFIGASLADANNNSLYESRNMLLIAKQPENRNWYTLYGIFVIKPNSEQLNRGVIPFVHLNNNFARSTVMQMQFYHLKNFAFENIEQLWDYMTQNYKIDLYNPSDYPLESSIQSITYKIYDSVTGQTNFNYIVNIPNYKVIDLTNIEVRNYSGEDYSIYMTKQYKDNYIAVNNMNNIDKSIWKGVDCTETTKTFNRDYDYIHGGNSVTYRITIRPNPDEEAVTFVYVDTARVTTTDGSCWIEDIHEVNFTDEYVEIEITIGFSGLHQSTTFTIEMVCDVTMKKEQGGDEPVEVYLHNHNIPNSRESLQLPHIDRSVYTNTSDLNAITEIFYKVDNGWVKFTGTYSISSDEFNYNVLDIYWDTVPAAVGVRDVRIIQKFQRPLVHQGTDVICEAALLCTKDVKDMLQ